MSTQANYNLAAAWSCGVRCLAPLGILGTCIALTLVWVFHDGSADDDDADDNGGGGDDGDDDDKNEDADAGVAGPGSRSGPDGSHDGSFRRNSRGWCLRPQLIFRRSLNLCVCLYEFEGAWLGS